MSKNKTGKKSSIAFQLSIRFTIVLAITIIVLAVLFQFAQWHNMINRQNKDLLNTAQRVMNQFKEEAYEQPEMFEQIDAQSFDIPYYMSYVIYNTDTKQVIATNDPFLPMLAAAETKAVRLVIEDYFMDGDLNVLYCTKSDLVYRVGLNAINLGSSIPLTIQLSIDMTNDTTSRMLRGLPRTIIIMLVPILLISFFALYFISRRTMRPVTRITKAAESISSTNLDTLLPVSAKNNELDYLAKTFNSLFQRLKADFDKEHAFTSNVSHELKTPVAVILGQANLLRRWGKDDPAQLEKSLGTIIDEAHSMESVISNLLMMTHMENGTYQFQIEEVNVGELFEKVKTEFATVAPKMEIEIYNGDSPLGKNEQRGQTPLIISTDKELLRQVLVVIISNSLRYAGEDCKITIKADGKTISICDNGDGFGEDVLPHVFDRFYRGDKAHNRDKGGSGLGLSIAKTIIEALGGKISASNASPKGACVTISF